MKMKSLGFALLALALCGATQARDTVLNIPLKDVLELPEARQKLDPNFRFYLAGANTPKVEKKLGDGVTNPKTNGVGKSDEYGCKWVILSGLIKLQESAKANGADAVVNLVSYYKKNETRSAETIECHAGAILIGAALKGDYVKLQ